MYKKELLYLCQEYSIDTNGVVYGKNDKPLRPANNSKGYSLVNLMIDGRRVGIAVHTLVATQFLVPPSPQHNQVNHINGIKTDNSVANLEWVTPKENMAHAINTLHYTPGASTRRRIQGFDPDTNTIVTFISLSEAARSLQARYSKASKGGISAAMHKGCRAYGYYWSYID